MFSCYYWDYVWILVTEMLQNFSFFFPLQCENCFANVKCELRCMLWMEIFYAMWEKKRALNGFLLHNHCDDSCGVLSEGLLWDHSFRCCFSIHNFWWRHTGIAPVVVESIHRNIVFVSLALSCRIKAQFKFKFLSMFSVIQRKNHSFNILILF